MENIKSIKSLIKLQNWKVDEKRRAIGVLEGRRIELVQYIKDLDKQIAIEKEAWEDVFIGVNFGEYVLGVGRKQDEARTKIAKLDEEIDVLKDALADLFQDLKQYEIVLEQREKRIKDAEAKAEQDMLDEVGLNLHLRKNKSDL